MAEIERRVNTVYICSEMFDKNVLGEYLEQYSEIYTGHPVLLGW
jgi:hypothetical protein